MKDVWWGVKYARVPYEIVNWMKMEKIDYQRDDYR